MRCCEGWFLGVGGVGGGGGGGGGGKLVSIERYIQENSIRTAFCRT